MVPESMKNCIKARKATSYLRPVFPGSSRSATIGGRVWKINGDTTGWPRYRQWTSIMFHFPRYLEMGEEGASNSAMSWTINFF